MKPLKVHIVFYFLKFRFTRLFRSNKVSKLTIWKWKKNLLNSPFYKNLIDKNSPFPIIDKSKFMEYFNTINTAKIKKEDAFEVALNDEKLRKFSTNFKNLSVGLSSGTSGNKGIFLTNSREKAIWVGAILDRVIGFTLKKRKVAFFLRANNDLYESVKSKILQFSFFDIMLPIEGYISELDNLKPDILVAQPSVLMQIAQNYKNKNITPSFNKVISVAEVLENDQKIYLEKTFKCIVIQVYQCTEGFLAYTCSKGALHFNEDWLKIEKKYIDDKKTRFHPVITDFLRITQPIVRYELNDIIHEGKACNCGSKATVISKIEGRSDDIFIFRKNELEIIIYPDFIRRAVITSSENIINYVITLIAKNTVKVYIETENNVSVSEEFFKVKLALLRLFKSNNLDEIIIINSEKPPNKLNKLIRIKNEYSKSI